MRGTIKNVVAGLSMAATLTVGSVAYAITPGPSSAEMRPGTLPARGDAALVFGEADASAVLQITETAGEVSLVGGDPVAPEPPPGPTVKVEAHPDPDRHR